MAPRSKTQPTLVYFNRSGESVQLDRDQAFYPNGTILHYSCEDGDPTEASAIQCQGGEWISLLLPCGKYLKL